MQHDVYSRYPLLDKCCQSSLVANTSEQYADVYIPSSVRIQLGTNVFLLFLNYNVTYVNVLLIKGKKKKTRKKQSN